MQDYLIIVGGGIQGLVIAYYALKYNKAKKVIIFEKQKYLGGLASCIKINNFWADRFYHHYFKSDRYFLDLLHELNLESNLLKKTFPSNFGDLGKSFNEKIALGSLLLIPNYKFVQNMTIKHFLRIFKISDNSDLTNLLKRKFGNYYKDLSVAWLWARIHARFSILTSLKAFFYKKETLYFLYPSTFVLFEKLQQNIMNMQGKILLNKDINSLNDILNSFNFNNIKNGKVSIVFTTPLSVTKKILNNFIVEYNYNRLKKTLKNKFFSFNLFKKKVNLIPDVKYAGVLNILVAITKKNKISKKGKINDPKKAFKCYVDDNNIYWEHLSSEYRPFVVKVAQHVAFTNMPFQLFYIGGYVPDVENISKYESLGKEIVFKILDLKNLDKEYCNFKIIVTKNMFASHIPTVDYVKNMPSRFLGAFKFGKNNLKIYLSSFAQLFPWDRGVNYAIKQGLDIVNML